MHSTQIKTYDEFVALLNEMQKSDPHTNTRQLMQDKGYFFAPDFDKKNILAHHVQLHNYIALWTAIGLWNNTLAQYKTTSNKVKFLDECLCDFGKDHLAYLPQRGGCFIDNNGNTIDFHTDSADDMMINYLLFVTTEANQDIKSESPDAEIISRFFQFGDGYDKELKNMNDAWLHNVYANKFKHTKDPYDRLKQNLFYILGDINEKSGNTRFIKFAKQWEQVAKNMDTRLPKAKLAINNNELKILTLIKSGTPVKHPKDITTLSTTALKQISISELKKQQSLTADDILAIYEKAPSNQLLKLLIQRAPLNERWYKKITDKIYHTAGINFIRLSDKNYKQSKEDYILLTTFNDKFKIVAENTEKHIKESAERKNNFEKELDQLKLKRKSVDTQIDKLKKDIDAEIKYLDDISRLENDFTDCVLRGKLTEKEKIFYTKYKEIINQCRKSLGKVAQNVSSEISGKPWVLLGTTAEKERLEQVKTIFKKLMELYKNPVASFSKKNYTELRKLEQELQILRNKISEYEWGINLEKKYSDKLLREKEIIFDVFAIVLAKAEENHKKKTNTPLQTFVETHICISKKSNTVMQNSREK